MKRLIAALLPVLLLGASPVPDHDVPAEFGLVEGVAWDPFARHLLAGSVDNGALLVREGDRWRQAVLPYPTGGILGLAVDPYRGVLWLTSAVVGPTKRKDGFRGLIGVTTLGFEPYARVPMPAGDTAGQPGDLAIAPNGTVYVSDGMAGGLYACPVDCKQLAPLVPAGTFRSPQGLAMSRSGKSLFVADYSKGLWRVDLSGKKVKAMVQISPMKGIDGLVRDGDALIAIINGNGKKVVRLTLDPTQTTIASEAVLATSAGPGDPTLGVIVGGHLVYVADAQWDRYDAAGRASGTARPTPIRSIALPPGLRPKEVRPRRGGGSEQSPFGVRQN